MFMYILILYTCIERKGIYESLNLRELQNFNNLIRELSNKVLGVNVVNYAGQRINTKYIRRGWCKDILFKKEKIYIFYNSLLIFV